MSRCGAAGIYAWPEPTDGQLSARHPHPRRRGCFHGEESTRGSSQPEIPNVDIVLRAPYSRRFRACLCTCCHPSSLASFASDSTASSSRVVWIEAGMVRGLREALACRPHCPRRPRSRRFALASATPQRKRTRRRLNEKEPDLAGGSTRGPSQPASLPLSPLPCC